MKEQKQTMRYTNEELEIIKNTFSEDDDLLKRIRKVMLQMPLNVLDLSILELAKRKEILNILRKSFLPTLDPEAPLDQVVDLWMTISIVNKTPDEAYPHLLAREKLIEYLDQQLKVLEGKKKIEIKFSELTEIQDKTSLEMYVDLVTRNMLLSHVEMQLNVLRSLSKKGETPEETQERLQKDSSK